MGGGSGKGGLSNSQSNETTNSGALQQLAQTATGQSSALMNLAFPGLSSATQHAESLSTGDPGLIAQQIAPAVQQVTQATTGAKQQIMNNAPAGGERALALENADVSQGAQVGNLASQGYNNSFNTLAQLGQSGVSQSQSALGLGTSNLAASNSGYNQVANQSIEQKGATLGAIGSGIGDATSLATFGLGGGFGGGGGGASKGGSMAGGSGGGSAWNPDWGA